MKNNTWLLDRFKLVTVVDNPHVTIPITTDDKDSILSTVEILTKNWFYTALLQTVDQFRNESDVDEKDINSVIDNSVYNIAFAGLDIATKLNTKEKPLVGSVDHRLDGRVITFNLANLETFLEFSYVTVESKGKFNTELNILFKLHVLAGSNYKVI